MGRYVRLILAVLIATLFSVVALIVFTRLDLRLSVIIGLAWVASGYYAAARVNKERVNVRRPAMGEWMAFAFALCGPLALFGSFAWQIIDVIVYGK
ncbi:hypothetical protein [Ancrocorticia populi]|uniref:Uncharacterized protein n=2 Tax=Ancrocorticia populi TaxID=2175228 RepID=A0A2V1K5L4_9ACTO|nr:hypothetical protein [Ancrocorticia populi]PWF26594.1 hypothetical protein DD236_07050 [Ancrocorticia populi]